MRIIPTYIHGVLDYLVGILLIAAPWLLNFAVGGVETWVPVVLGGGIIVYSLLTDYELGVIHAIRMPTHLLLDTIGGVLLAASPWVFGFSHYVYLPHLIVGLFEIVAAAMTRTIPSQASSTHRHAGAH